MADKGVRCKAKSTARTSSRWLGRSQPNRISPSMMWAGTSTRKHTDWSTPATRVSGRHPTTGASSSRGGGNARGGGAGTSPCTAMRPASRTARSNHHRQPTEQTRWARPPSARLDACRPGGGSWHGVHHLGRVFAARGHTVRLMSPEYVRPYVQAQKNDELDAEAIAEARMKSQAQSDIQALHRARERLVSERTALINHLRGAAAGAWDFGATGPPLTGRGTLGLCR